MVSDRAAPGSRARARHWPILWLLTGLMLVTGFHAKPSLATSFNIDSTRIGVVTIEPGQTYWERFGHNAILIDLGDGSEPLLYNFGMFDFDQPGFMGKFIAGQMRYRLTVEPYRRSLADYQALGRGATLQWLALDPDQRRELIAILQWNALPENVYYRYDYFLDNCSTRVRDALDHALGGRLQRQLIGRSRGLSYRFEAMRLGAEPLWMGLGMSLGLGPFAERPLSRWDEAFVPMRLREALREVTTADGSPLVLSEQSLLPHRLHETAVAAPRWWPRFLILGVALAVLIGRLHARPRALAWALGSFWLLTGLIGLGLAGLWLASDHRAAWGNENLLLFDPLALALLPIASNLARRRAIGPWQQRLLLVILLLAGAAAFLKFLPFRFQDNIDWIVLMLPIHFAAWSATRKASKAHAVVVPAAV